MFELQATDLKIKRTMEKEEKNKEELKDQSIKNLGKELANEKIKNMQKDQELKDLSKSLGAEVATLKIEIMKLKGGAK